MSLTLSSPTVQPFSDKAVPSVVERARHVFPRWSSLSFRERAGFLEKVRRQLAREAKEWAELISDEIGKPIVEAMGADVLGSLESLQILIREGEKWVAPQRLFPTFLDRIRGVRLSEIVYEPLGVIGIIGTWNYPLLINLQQIASALLCGNVVVWKPSELSSRVAQRLDRLFAQAELPKGVLTTLSADRAMGEELVRAGCDKILFTGKGRTGQQILAQLAEKKVPAILELSGMDAALVLSDAPCAYAARALAWGSMTCGGQSCVASRRIIVHKDLWSKFVPVFVQEVRSLRMGDTRDPETDVGPLRSENHLERLEMLVQEAIEKGAKVLTGGHRMHNLHGPFFELTVLSHLDPSMKIVQEEFFGPVALLFSAGDEAQMVASANESPYGLGASIWSRRPERARRLAATVHAGTVWINDVLFSAADIRLPFGGMKGSGYGRVHGAEGLRQLMHVKAIQTHRPGGFRPYYFPYDGKKLEQLSRYLHGRHG